MTKAASLGAMALLAACGTAAASPPPPKRPAGLIDITSLAPKSDGQPLVLAQAATRPALSDRAAIDKANAALNSVTTMSADFAQVGGDRRRLTGTLYLQRPGKLRFEYNKPSTQEVVSDGSTVLVRDRKLNTSDPYPISQTPLKFLLSARIDLARESSVKSVATDPDGVRVTIEDSTTLGGSSRITLSFDPEITTLKRWRVVDPQGYTTTVTLSDIEKNRTLDPKIFMLNYMRPVE